VELSEGFEGAVPLEVACETVDEVEVEPPATEVDSDTDPEPAATAREEDIDVPAEVLNVDGGEVHAAPR
jgi:hypothetical protein